MPALIKQAMLKQISRSNGGLPKHAISQPVMMDATGVEGDRHRDLRYHGGPNKAVLMIAAELIDSLAARGFPIYYGALGENRRFRTRPAPLALWPALPHRRRRRHRTNQVAHTLRQPERLRAAYQKRTL
jgi:hypothetical protein